MSIHLTHGDLLKQDDVDAIVNTVNCVGVMGKGLALQFKQAFPTMFDAYAREAKAGRIVNGQGADTDIIVASAKAYLSALNKMGISSGRVNPQYGEEAVAP